MQAEALETLVNNHYKGLIAAIASHIQDKVEANIRDWLSNEFKNQLEHHQVLTADKYDSKSDAEISDYFERHDFISANNIDYHLDKYMRNSDLVTEDSLSDSIHDWMGRNFDISNYEIEDAVKEAVRSMDFTVEVS
jgi:hypothetical protein